MGSDHARDQGRLSGLCARLAFVRLRSAFRGGQRCRRARLGIWLSRRAVFDGRIARLQRISPRIAWRNRPKRVKMHHGWPMSGRIGAARREQCKRHEDEACERSGNHHLAQESGCFVESRAREHAGLLQAAPQSEPVSSGARRAPPLFRVASAKMLPLSAVVEIKPP